MGTVLADGVDELDAATSVAAAVEATVTALSLGESADQAVAAEQSSKGESPSGVGTVKLNEMFAVDSDDASGRNRFQLNDSNWTLIEQSPANGSPVGDDPRIGAIKNDEVADCDEDSCLS